MHGLKRTNASNHFVSDSALSRLVNERLIAYMAAPSGLIASWRKTRKDARTKWIGSEPIAKFVFGESGAAFGVTAFVRSFWLSYQFWIPMNPVTTNKVVNYLTLFHSARCKSFSAVGIVRLTPILFTAP